MSSFGIRLKKLRIENSLTQSQLAQKLNELGCSITSKSTISQYENGKRFPDIECLENMADLFYISVDYLLGSDIANDEERIILSLFRKLDEKGKFLLTAYAASLYHHKAP